MGQQNHIARRVEMVAANVHKGPSKPPEGSKETAHLEAYGGLVKGKTDAALKKALVEKVASLNGMTFSPSEITKFAEFEYRGGRRCVFFLANKIGEEGVVKLRFQAEEVEKEVEE